MTFGTVSYLTIRYITHTHTHIHSIQKKKLNAQEYSVYNIPIIYSVKFRESQNLPSIKNKNKHLR